jgi:hypothetical protein
MRVVLEPVGFDLSGTTFHRLNDEQFAELVNLQAGVRHLASKSAVTQPSFNIPWELLTSLPSTV